MFYTFCEKKTGLLCLGILKYGNDDLTLSWMYVLSTDTPIIIRAQEKQHTLTMAWRPPCVGYMGGIECACAMLSHKRFLGASEVSESKASRN